MIIHLRREVVVGHGCDVLEVAVVLMRKKG